jgi:programmed cell death 6-interacting protein
LGALARDLPLTPLSDNDMPNQLHIPFKQTSPAQIKDAVESYIEFNHTDAHPDAFKWDISRWEELRKEGVGGYVHVNRVEAALLSVCK